MTNKPEINSLENWWSEVLRYPFNHFQSSCDLLFTIDKQIEELDHTAKQRLVDRLTQIALKGNDGFEIALDILEKHCTPDNLELIYKKARSLRLTDRDLMGYLRVIACKGQDAHKGLLEDVLFSEPMSRHHDFIQWSTYPNYPDLFVRAYSRYLIDTDYARWSGSLVVQSFMTRPHALSLLKNHLEKTNHDVWLKMKHDLEVQLTKNLWSNEDKTTIAHIIALTGNQR
jgi:hypothetical protein